MAKKLVGLKLEAVTTTSLQPLDSPWIVLTNITFRLKGGDANHQSTASISKSDSAKSALERLGKPYAIMRSENGTSYLYKDSNGDESSFSTQGNKIFSVMSAEETKRLQGITGMNKNQ